LVCEYSLQKHCPGVEVIHTYDVPFIPSETQNKLHRDRWEGGPEWLPVDKPTGTMFSFCRAMVPEICGFEGEAIYLDSDMIVFESIEAVWNLPMNGAKILRLEAGQFAVMKWDCEDVQAWSIGTMLRAGIPYREILTGRIYPKGFVRCAIPNKWNSTDRMPKGGGLLHFTRMPTQPWVRPGHPLGGVWFDLLAEAVESGFLHPDLVHHEVREQDITSTWQAAIWPQPHVLTELEKRL